MRLAMALAMVAPVPAAVLAVAFGGVAGIAAALVSLGLGVGAALLLRGRPAPPAVADTKLNRLRHDLRGALSPALLTTDRLLASSDPAVQRSGSVIAQSLERAVALLKEAGRPG